MESGEAPATKVADLTPAKSGCCVRCRVVSITVEACMESNGGAVVRCADAIVGDVRAPAKTRVMLNSRC
jgi:hypothetical protein